MSDKPPTTDKAALVPIASTIATPATPSSPSAATPASTPGKLPASLHVTTTMDSARTDVTPEQPEGISTVDTQPAAVVAETSSPATKAGASNTQDKKKKTKLIKGKKKAKGKRKLKCSKTGKKKKMEDSSSESSSDSGSSSSSSSDSSDSDSDSSDSDSTDYESEKTKKKKSKKQKGKDKRKAVKKKARKSKKSKHRDDSSDSSDSDSDSDSESSSGEEETKKKKKKKRTNKSREEEVKDKPAPAKATITEDKTALPTDSTTTTTASTATTAAVLPAATLENTMAQMLTLLQQLTAPNAANAAGPGASQNATLASGTRQLRGRRSRRARAGTEVEELKPKKGGPPEYKRVDQLWDSNIHDYKLTETAEEHTDEFDGYVFHVRRRFDWENKYRNTVVDIKSHYLRDALQEIMKDVKAVSLVENQPVIDPNMLFLHVEEMKKFYKKTLKARLKKEKKKKQIKRLTSMRAHLKLMISYIDKDFDGKKKAIVPMIKSGNITFEYLWALFKPNTLAYTSTYGSSEHPRCFKVDLAYSEKNFMRGEYYVVEGRYLDTDGKSFGHADFEVQIDHFKGPRKITSLATYPIEHHKDPEGLKVQLLERGKQFVNLAGMNFKVMKGLAFQKRKKQVLKFNINGRIMVDPKTFRRINANYQVSGIKDEQKDDDEGQESDCSSCGEESEAGEETNFDADDDANDEKPKYRVVWDDNHKPHVVRIDDEEVPQKQLDQLPNGDVDETPAADKQKSRDFTIEELVIASPVVLGFSFTEKSWFEFAVSDISDIQWNDEAFEKLVLPKDHKELVKAQVRSHKFHAAETIDDVIQGKGKGLVFVLHGPPGVGKTLTAEGIAEFLRCPLYAVSAGDLGTDARTLEHELNKIMDIAHSWGAVLLLDEADVFLEKRQHQDIHRNALVSIFLRLLEYFQGILFLTTNRVETFDEAFQSRIHIALKYSELGIRAKRDIWKSFLAMVKAGGGKVDDLSVSQLDELAKHKLNGRQIKNMVRSAQALAVLNKETLSMRHLKQSIEVTESFERDLKGGTGYDEAMRSYT